MQNYVITQHICCFNISEWYLDVTTAILWSQDVTPQVEHSADVHPEKDLSVSTTNRSR